MQQNTSFKLDRISIDDKFSPKTLNDNAAQVEAALNTMSTMMVAGDTALRTDLDGVDQRVTALEAKKMVLGSYKGTGSNGIGSQIIELGFSPIALIVCGYGHTGLVLRDSQNAQLKLTETGFVAYNSSGVHFNNYPSIYNYIAFA